MKKEKVKNIIVVGSSAGGISAVSRLMRTFPQDLNAAVFIVIHVSANSMVDVILNQVKKHTRMICKIPSDDEKIEIGTVYFAPADRHMLISDGKIHVQKGPHENHWRPSIDVLFRTAAAAYDSCVTGIILTGLLDDGVSGMAAIKRSGGRCIVQDPSEAEFGDMPYNVIRNVDVDHCVSVDEIGYIISDVFSRENCEVSSVPDDVKLEADITLRMTSNPEYTAQLGDMTVLICPECGGVLSEIKDAPSGRYRCYTGHAFTSEALDKSQARGLEESLWVALRMMEERKNLIKRMIEERPEQSDDPVNNSRTERAAQIDIHIDRLKAMLRAQT